jgi:hypothetical protein
MAARSRAIVVAGVFLALSSACALAAGGEPRFTAHGTKLVSPGAFAFGSGVAMSADGRTLLASAEEGRIEAFALSGSRWVSQGALRIPGYQGTGKNCSLGLSGNGNLAAVETGDAVEMFARKNSRWFRVTALKSPDPLTAVAGEFVALSADGATVVSSSSVGYALVFARSGKAWRQQASLEPTADTNADFGTSAAISANGNVVAIGGPRDVGGDPTEPQPTDVGAWVFARAGSSWKQVGPALAPSNGDSDFGVTIAIGADGARVLVGGELGETWEFGRSGSRYVPARRPSPVIHAKVSCGLALSGDGRTAALGGCSDIGHVAVSTLTSHGWAPLEADITPNGAIGNAGFGASVALSSTGRTLVVGGPDDGDGHGAVWVYRR